MTQEQIEIKTTLAAWMYSTSSPADLLSAVERGDTYSVFSNIHFHGDPSKKKFSDYIRIGEADITLRLAPRDEQTRMAVKMLNDKLNELRAAYLTKQQQILDQISKLQALEYVSSRGSDADPIDWETDVEAK